MTNDKKWVYLSYILVTLIVAWVLNQATQMALGYLRWSNPIVAGVLPASALGSFAVSVAAALLYFRQEKVQVYSFEVLQELSKVTWPKRKNAFLSTIVVLVTVVFIAAVLAFFDWACSKLIGLVLKA